MPNDKTTNYEFDLINDSDSVKAGVKTKPNANWNALDGLLHDDFATKDYVDDAIEDLDLPGYATIEYVNENDIKLDVNNPFTRVDSTYPLIIDLDYIRKNYDEYPEPTTHTYQFEDASIRESIAAWVNKLQLDENGNGSFYGSVDNNEVLFHINAGDSHPNTIYIYSDWGYFPDSLNNEIFLDLETSDNWQTISQSSVIHFALAKHKGIMVIPCTSTPQYTSDGDLAIWNNISDKPDLTAYATQASQDAQDVLIEKSWKDGEPVNLVPWSYSGLEDSAYDINNGDTSGDYSSSDWVESDWVNARMLHRYGGLSLYFNPIEGLEAGEDYVILVELRNRVQLTDSPGSMYVRLEMNGTDQGSDWGSQLLTDGDGVLSKTFTKNSTETVAEFTATAIDPEQYEGTITNFFRLWVYCGTGKMQTCEVRASVYKASEYDGKYHPYGDISPEQAKGILRSLEPESYATKGYVNEKVLPVADQADRAWKDGEAENLYAFFADSSYVLPSSIASNVSTVDDDGWVTLSGTKGTTTINFNLPFTPDASKSYTMLAEYKNLASTGSGTKATMQAKAAAAGNSLGPSSDTYAFYLSASSAVSGSKFVQLNVYDGAESDIVKFSFVLKNVSVQVRISLYEGDYSGPYRSKGDISPTQAKAKLAELEKAYKSDDVANLTGFFSEPLDSSYWSDNDEPIDTSVITNVGDDGWGRFTIASGDYGHGLQMHPEPFRLPGYAPFTKSFTLLVEIKNVSRTSADGTVQFEIYPASLTTLIGYGDDENDVYTIEIADGVYRVPMFNGKIDTYTIPNPESNRAYGDWCSLFENYISTSDGFEGTFDMRMSLYEGDYDGPYIPYDPNHPKVTAMALGGLADDVDIINYISHVYNDVIGLVVFYPNGGAFRGTGNYLKNSVPGMDEDVNMQGYLVGSTFVLSHNWSVTRDGYTFSGWNTRQDGTGTSYAHGATVTPDRNSFHLYAQWTPAS